MPSITFTDFVTVAPASWLNEVNYLRHDNEGASGTKFLPDGTGGVSRNVQGKLREYVSVTDFFPAGYDPSSDANYVQTTDYFNAALAAHSSVFVPAGTYVVNRIALQTNNHLFGEGWSSILKQRASAPNETALLEINTLSTNSPDPNNNKKNIRVSDLLLQGRVATEGFSEFAHLFQLMAASDVIVERVKFSGFKGDGLVISPTYFEVHNQRITVRDCFFDGENNDNRNGISVVECDGALIENNYLVRCTRSNMPGAIDIEPDGIAHFIVRDIIVRENRIINCGGNVGGICIVLPSTAFTTTPTGFTIENNTIDGGNSFTDFGITCLQINNATESRKHSIKIINNRIARTLRGLRLFGIANALVQGNTFDTTLDSPLIGFNTGVEKCLDIHILDNFFDRLAERNGGSGTGLTIFTVDRIKIEGNTFKDCGRADGTLGDCINFDTGTSSYVEILNNQLIDPLGRTTGSITKTAGHTFTSSTNRFFGNIFGVGIPKNTNTFLAEDSDQLYQTYTPIIGGTTSAGSGTYIVQRAIYTRQGNLMYVNVRVQAAAGHTGTGGIQISLPKNAFQRPFNDPYPISVAITDNLGVTQTVYGFINDIAVLGGVTGTIRVAQNVSGASPALIAIPASAFEVTVSGYYICETT
jgi:hypothetical protein